MISDNFKPNFIMGVFGNYHQKGRFGIINKIDLRLMGRDIWINCGFYSALAAFIKMTDLFQVALKNILTVVLARRNAYRLREGKFRYAMGSHLPHPSYRNAVHVYEDSEVRSVKHVYIYICIHPKCRILHTPNVGFYTPKVGFYIPQR